MDIKTQDELDKVHSMLLRAYMDAMKLPYQTVGDSNVTNIRDYLCEQKIMPAHLVSEYLVKKYGLIDNQPSLEEAKRKTKELQDLANKVRLDSSICRCKCGNEASAMWLSTPVCKECFAELMNEAQERQR